MSRGFHPLEWDTPLLSRSGQLVSCGFHLLDLLPFGHPRMPRGFLFSPGGLFGKGDHFMAFALPIREQTREGQMTETEALQILRQHFESLFPMACTTCGRQFPSLRDYILLTKPLGSARSYDADLGEWTNQDPIGGQVFANCSCGTTMTLGTDGMALPQVQGVLGWLHAETLRRGVSPSVVLEGLRDRIRQEILSEPR